jgi:hypothetical protein
MGAMLHATFRNLNAAEISGSDRELAAASATLAIVSGLSLLHRLARRDVKRAVEAAARSAHLPTQAYVSLLIGVYSYSCGQFARAGEAFAAGLELFDRMGDHFRWQETMGAMSYQSLFQARFDEARDRFARLEASLDDHPSEKIHVWTLAGRLLCDLVQAAPAPADVEALEVLLRAELDHGDAILAAGVAAQARLRLADHGAALADARRVEALITRMPPSAAYVVFGVYGALLTFVRLAEQSDETARPALLRSARRVCGCLRLLARQNPTHAALAWLALGQTERVSGNRGRASRALSRCIAGATGNEYLTGQAADELERVGEK